MRRLIVFILCLLGVPFVQAQTTLSQAAAAMSPGTWQSLSTSGFNNGSVLRSPDGSGLEFMDKAAWNPIAKTVMIVGGAHPSGGACSSDVSAKYSDATNTWSTFALVCPTLIGFNNSEGHAYEHDTVDLVTGDFYHRGYNSNRVAKFSQATQSWSLLAAAIPSASQCCGVLEYFPDRNSLVFLDSDSGVFEYSLSGGTWTQRASTNLGGFSPQLTGLGNSGAGHYSAICHCIVLGGGGGSTTLYKFSASGAFTSVASAPQQIFTPQAGGGAVFTVDPATGKFLLWANANAPTTMYELDPVANTWATISRAAPVFPGPEGGVFDVVAIPISDYKVTMFVSVSSGSFGAVYLYKHANPTPEMDYAVRTSDPRVFMSNALDNSGDIDGAWGANHGNCCAGSPTNGMFVNTSIKASGPASMECKIPANFLSSDPCRDFFQNFSTTNTLTFGDNSTFYMEWRQYFPAAYLNEVHTGGDGWKQIILSKGDNPACPGAINSTNCPGSCTDNELVAFNSQELGHQMYYQSCVNFSPLQPNASSPWNGANHLRQNVPAPNGTVCNVATDPGCNRCWASLNPNAGQPGSTRFPPLGSCIAYAPDEWMTFKVKVTLGTWNSGNVCDGGFQQGSGGPFYPGYQNSQVDAWIARAGQPFQQAISFPLCLIAPAHETYSKVWFLVYDTNSTNMGPSAKSVYWDELILSTADIAAPGQTVAAPSAPAVSLSPSSVNFGTQLIAATSGSQAVTLTNTGAATLTIGSISFTGTNAGDFAQTNNCGSSLATSSNCTINVTFTPLASGSRSANLSVASNAATTPDTVPVTGVGLLNKAIFGSGKLFGSGKVNP